MHDHLKHLAGGLIGVSGALLLMLFAVYGANTPLIMSRLLDFTPQLLTGTVDYSEVRGGFFINVSISVLSMLLAMIVGSAIGIGMLSPSKLVRWTSTLIMNAFRNSPWLVILYAMLYLLPFHVQVFGRSYEFSPYLKAMIGLSLPVMAYMAEILRGALETIHIGQWESARALGYKPLQVLRWVIIPQAIPRMIPNVMSLYAMVVIGSSLIVVTGTADVLSTAKVIAATHGDRLSTALYLYVLFMFFIYCFPIAILSRWYERRILELSR